MTATPVTRPARIAAWLIPAGAGVLLAIGMLWFLRPTSGYCMESYPPQCVTTYTDGPAVVAGILLILVFAALAIVAALATGPVRTPLLIAGVAALGLITLVGVLASLAGRAPIPYY